ncbi:MAG: GNAT family N-acetyltransferase [Pleurocapsa minor GSE-CHR-MK-17-07R]|jgi:GNAT superfamily N-acetyltransferase|nr:GNAT family N-acetyltransferase [Pleurocapsa minor GSE-CHR-MK 17-07R]
MTTKPLSRTLQHRRIAIDAYWASFIGCDAARIHDASPTPVIVNPEIDRLIAYCPLDAGATVAVQDVSLLDLGRKVQLLLQDGVTGPQAVQHERSLRELCASEGLYHVYGPAMLHYLKDESVREISSYQPVRLGAADSGLLDEFLFSLNLVREYSLTDSEVFPYAVGIFMDDQMVAYGTVRVWADTLAEIFLDVLQKYRGRGIGKSLVTHLTSWVLENTPWIPQYDAEVTNVHSMSLASRCGYSPYVVALFAS